MNLLTSDRILKNIVDLCRWIFESLFVVFWLSMVSKPWSHGCHLGITLKDFLNPFACEGHNSFVENLLSTGAQRYILITHLITEIAFSLWAYRLPNSNAKTRPEGSRICLLFCCIFGQCRVLYRKIFGLLFYIIDLSRVSKYMLSRILLLELSNVFTIMYDNFVFSSSVLWDGSVRHAQPHGFVH